MTFSLTVTGSQVSVFKVGALQIGRLVLQLPVGDSIINSVFFCGFGGSVQVNGEKLYGPLHVAAEWGRDLTVSLLVRLRAEVNMQNREGGTSRE